MKVSFVVARVEVGCVQRRYSVQRETLIRVGICEVRCMRKTELHLTLPAREQPSKLLLAREVPTRGCARQGRSRPTHIYLWPDAHLKRRRNRADTEPFSPVRLSERGASHQVFSRCPFASDV